MQFPTNIIIIQNYGCIDLHANQKRKREKRNAKNLMTIENCIFFSLIKIIDCKYVIYMQVIIHILTVN